MSGKVWYWLADGTEDSELYPSLKAAKAGLNRTLQKQTSRGYKVGVDLKIGEEGDNPLWIVEHEGEIIAKYRLIENT